MQRNAGSGQSGIDANSTAITDAGANSISVVEGNLQSNADGNPDGKHMMRPQRMGRTTSDSGLNFHPQDLEREAHWEQVVKKDASDNKIGDGEASSGNVKAMSAGQNVTAAGAVGAPAAGAGSAPVNVAPAPAGAAAAGVPPPASVANAPAAQPNALAFVGGKSRMPDATSFVEISDYGDVAEQQLGGLDDAEDLYNGRGSVESLSYVKEGRHKVLMSERPQKVNERSTSRSGAVASSLVQEKAVNNEPAPLVYVNFQVPANDAVWTNVAKAYSKLDDFRNWLNSICDAPDPLTNRVTKCNVERVSLIDLTSNPSNIVPFVTVDSNPKAADVGSSAKTVLKTTAAVSSMLQMGNSELIPQYPDYVQMNKRSAVDEYEASRYMQHVKIEPSSFIEAPPESDFKKDYLLVAAAPSRSASLRSELLFTRLYRQGEIGIVSEKLGLASGSLKSISQSRGGSSMFKEVTSIWTKARVVDLSAFSTLSIVIVVIFYLVFAIDLVTAFHSWRFGTGKWRKYVPEAPTPSSSDDASVADELIAEEYIED